MSDGEPGTRPQRYIGNILLPLAVLVVAAAFLVQTLGFPGGNGDVGPAGVPYLWIGFLVLLCVGGLCLYLVAIRWLLFVFAEMLYIDLPDGRLMRRLTG